MLLAVPRHIVISDAAAADLAAINLVDPNRVTLIYNGVNARNFRPDRGVRAAFLREHAHIPETEQGADLFVVGCGGRLEAIKGHHQLAVAMKLVLARHRNVVLLVAGSGGEGHRYEELARQGLRVHMLGMLPQERLSDFYRSIDVFVDPFYQHHGLNTVMLEAALSGTPIVVTRLASAATTVPCDGGLGLTFTLGSPEELAERLEYLLDHPTERARMGAAARERALLLFTSATMAGRYERALYDAYLHPSPLLPIRGDVVCKRTYPAMCYRTPEVGSETSDAVAEFHRKH
jgi:glycosyltransferase involved in cell wall biosynthesis